MMDGDLSQGVDNGHLLDDRCYSRDTVVSGILCSAWRRPIDRSAASGCRDYSSLSAFDWKTYLERRKKIASTDRIAPLK